MKAIGDKCLEKLEARGVRIKNFHIACTGCEHPLRFIAIPVNCRIRFIFTIDKPPFISLALMR